MLQAICLIDDITTLIKSSTEIYVIQKLTIALSACIYQSLCDSDTFYTRNTTTCSPGMEILARIHSTCQSSYLMSSSMAAKKQRKYSTEDPLSICTSPSKWPGVTNLRALLAREKDEDTPKLNILLTESFTATFISLLVCGIATSDCHLLYRLASHTFSDATWVSLYDPNFTEKVSAKISILR